LDFQQTPEACKQKARDCLAVADTMTDSKQKAAMLQYAEWWMRLSEHGHSPCVLINDPNPRFTA